MTAPARPFSNSKKQSGSTTLWVLIWLVGMAAIAFFCLVRHLPALELATENRISQALSQASATGITATVNGYTATLTGSAQNETQKQGFLALAAGTAGVKTVINELNLSKTAIATVNDDTPIVGKKINLEAVKLDTEGGKTKAEDLTVAKEAEEAAAEIAEAATQAAESETVKPIELEIIEDINSEQAVAATKDPSIKMDIEDGTLMLDGAVAKTDNLNLLIDQAKTSLEIDFVSNSTQALDDTKPATWLEPITALLPTMAPLEQPGISIVNNQITLVGVAPDQNTHDSVITRALQLLGDYSLVERIDIATAESNTIQKLDETDEAAKQASDVTEPAVEPIVEPVSDTVTEAQTNVSAEPTSTDTTASNTNDDPGAAIGRAFDLLPSTRILFKSGSNTLTTESLGVLDEIAQLLRDHPNVKMDIDGHTDASGDDKINLELSQSRANAVRDYLVEQGISVYRLTAYGFGEGMPIAKNDSPEGRALNRRIEFKF
ncbi:MAG: OmpA family protein [Granulosicoccaceae bacterium]